MKVKIIHVLYTHYICTGNFIIVWNPNVKAKYQCSNYVSVFRTQSLTKVKVTDIHIPTGQSQVCFSVDFMINIQNFILNVLCVFLFSQVLFEKVFLMRPIKALFVRSDDSLHEWRFRWALDRYVSELTTPTLSKFVSSIFGF